MAPGRSKKGGQPKGGKPEVRPAQILQLFRDFSAAAPQQQAVHGAVEEVAALVEAGQGGALACMALAKMHITRAYQLAAELAPEEELEARLKLSLGRALLAALAGAQLQASFQCLVLAAHLLHLCRGIDRLLPSGAAAPEENNSSGGSSGDSMGSSGWWERLGGEAAKLRDAAGGAERCMLLYRIGINRRDEWQPAGDALEGHIWPFEWKSEDAPSCEWEAYVQAKLKDVLRLRKEVVAAEAAQQEAEPVAGQHRRTEWTTEQAQQLLQGAQPLAGRLCSSAYALFVGRRLRGRLEKHMQRVAVQREMGRKGPKESPPPDRQLIASLKQGAKRHHKDKGSREDQQLKELCGKAAEVESYLVQQLQDLEGDARDAILARLAAVTRTPLGTMRQLIMEAQAQGELTKEQAAEALQHLQAYLEGCVGLLVIPGEQGRPPAATERALDRFGETLDDELGNPTEDQVMQVMREVPALGELFAFLRDHHAWKWSEEEEEGEEDKGRGAASPGQGNVFDERPRLELDAVPPFDPPPPSQLPLELLPCDLKELNLGQDASKSVGVSWLAAVQMIEQIEQAEQAQRGRSRPRHGTAKPSKWFEGLGGLEDRPWLGDSLDESEDEGGRLDSDDELLRPLPRAALPQRSGTPVGSDRRQRARLQARRRGGGSGGDGSLHDAAPGSGGEQHAEQKTQQTQQEWERAQQVDTEEWLHHGQEKDAPFSMGGGEEEEEEEEDRSQRGRPSPYPQYSEAGSLFDDSSDDEAASHYSCASRGSAGGMAQGGRGGGWEALLNEEVFALLGQEPDAESPGLPAGPDLPAGSSSELAAGKGAGAREAGASSPAPAGDSRGGSGSGQGRWGHEQGTAAGTAGTAGRSGGGSTHSGRESDADDQSAGTVEYPGSGSPGPGSLEKEGGPWEEASLGDTDEPKTQASSGSPPSVTGSSPDRSLSPLEFADKESPARYGLGCVTHPEMPDELDKCVRRQLLRTLTLGPLTQPVQVELLPVPTPPGLEASAKEAYLEVDCMLRPAVRGLAVLRAMRAVEQQDDPSMQLLASLNSGLGREPMELPKILQHLSQCGRLKEGDVLVHEAAVRTLEALTMPGILPRIPSQLPGAPPGDLQSAVAAAAQLHSVAQRPVGACAALLASMAAPWLWLAGQEGEGERLQEWAEQYKRELLADVLQAARLLAGAGRLVQTEREPLEKFVDTLFEDVYRQGVQATVSDQASRRRAEARELSGALQAHLQATFQAARDKYPSLSHEVLISHFVGRQAALAKEQFQPQAKEAALWAKAEDCLEESVYLSAAGLLPLRALCHLHAFLCTQLGLAFPDLQPLDPQLHEAVLLRAPQVLDLCQPASPSAASPSAADLGSPRDPRSQQGAGKAGPATARGPMPVSMPEGAARGASSRAGGGKGGSTGGGGGPCAADPQDPIPGSPGDGGKAAEAAADLSAGGAQQAQQAEQAAEACLVLTAEAVRALSRAVHTLGLSKEGHAAAMAMRAYGLVPTLLTEPLAPAKADGGSGGASQQAQHTQHTPLCSREGLVVGARPRPPLIGEHLSSRLPSAAPAFQRAGHLAGAAQRLAVAAKVVGNLRVAAWRKLRSEGTHAVCHKLKDEAFLREVLSDPEALRQAVARLQECLFHCTVAQHLVAAGLAGLVEGYHTNLDLDYDLDDLDEPSLDYKPQVGGYNLAIKRLDAQDELRKAGMAFSDWKLQGREHYTNGYRFWQALRVVEVYSQVAGQSEPQGQTYGRARPPSAREARLALGRAVDVVELRLARVLQRLGVVEEVQEALGRAFHTACRWLQGGPWVVRPQDRLADLLACTLLPLRWRAAWQQAEEARRARALEAAAAQAEEVRRQLEQEERGNQAGGRKKAAPEARPAPALGGDKKGGKKKKGAGGKSGASLAALPTPPAADKKATPEPSPEPLEAAEVAALADGEEDINSAADDAVAEEQQSSSSRAAQGEEDAEESDSQPGVDAAMLAGYARLLMQVQQGEQEQLQQQEGQGGQPEGQQARAGTSRGQGEAGGPPETEEEEEPLRRRPRQPRTRKGSQGTAADRAQSTPAGASAAEGGLEVQHPPVAEHQQEELQQEQQAQEEEEEEEEEEPELQEPRPAPSVDEAPGQAQQAQQPAGGAAAPGIDAALLEALRSMGLSAEELAAQEQLLLGAAAGANSHSSTGQAQAQAGGHPPGRAVQPPASSAAGRGGRGAGAGRAQCSRPEPRVVGWMGEWVCRCGREHDWRDGCNSCGSRAPCRDWMRGKCRYGPGCQYPHPLFDLPSEWPPLGARKGYIVMEATGGKLAPELRFRKPSQQQQQQQQQAPAPRAAPRQAQPTAAQQAPAPAPGAAPAGPPPGVAGELQGQRPAAAVAGPPVQHGEHAGQGMLAAGQGREAAGSQPPSHHRHPELFPAPTASAGAAPGPPPSAGSADQPAGTAGIAAPAASGAQQGPAYLPDTWLPTGAPARPQQAQHAAPWESAPELSVAPDAFLAALASVGGTSHAPPSASGSAWDAAVPPAAAAAFEGFPPHLLAALLDDTPPQALSSGHAVESGSVDSAAMPADAAAEEGTEVPPQQARQGEQAQQLGAPAPGRMRILSQSEWVCSCGTLKKLSAQPCLNCGHAAPCRAWCKGMCSLEGCPEGKPHPPFDTSGGWRPGGGRGVKAKLWEGAPRWVPPGVAADFTSTTAAPEPAPAAAAAAGTGSAWGAPGAVAGRPAGQAGSFAAAAAAAPAAAAPAGPSSPIPKLLATASAKVAARRSPLREPWAQQGQRAPGAAGLPPGLVGSVAREEVVDELELMLMSMGVSNQPAESALDFEHVLRSNSQQVQQLEQLLPSPAAAVPAEAPPVAAAAAPAGAPMPVAGLSNEAGEYNCFLNAIIQCLWHCKAFRRQVGAWPAVLREGDPVLRAVHGLFAALEWEESDRRRLGHAVLPDTRLSVVNPNQLREALGQLPGQLFEVGEMNDAGEVLLTIYELINQGVAALRQYGMAADVADLDAVCGLAVHEYVHCSACQLSTHDSHYTQYFYNTQATALRELRRQQHGRPTNLGQLLRQIEEQTLKSCDTDKGGCGARLPAVHALEVGRTPPRVFTLQLAWESQREEPGNIAATLAALSERVDLHSFYRGLAPGQHVYRLRSMVCYYGAHYFAFVLLPEQQQGWVMIDDTRVSRVGSWADVKRKCELGRVQPAMLFFEAQA